MDHGDHWVLAELVRIRERLQSLEDRALAGEPWEFLELEQIEADLGALEPGPRFRLVSAAVPVHLN